MLNLTRKTDYALVALAYLAQRRTAGEVAVSARRIADTFDLPLPLLMNILKELAHAKVLTATRGSAGGYTLARDAGQISLLEVITALEGPVQFAQCTDAIPGSTILGQGCVVASKCIIRDPVRRIHDRIRNLLEEITIADLVDSKVNVGVDEIGIEDLRGSMDRRGILASARD